MIRKVANALREALSRGRFYEHKIDRLQRELDAVVRAVTEATVEADAAEEVSKLLRIEVLQLEKRLQTEADLRSGAEQRAVDAAVEAAKWRRYRCAHGR